MPFPQKQVQNSGELAPASQTGASPPLRGMAQQRLCSMGITARSVPFWATYRAQQDQAKTQVLLQIQFSKHHFTLTYIPSIQRQGQNVVPKESNSPNKLKVQGKPSYLRRLLFSTGQECSPEDRDSTAICRRMFYGTIRPHVWRDKPQVTSAQLVFIRFTNPRPFQTLVCGVILVANAH